MSEIHDILQNKILRNQLIMAASVMEFPSTTLKNVRDKDTLWTELFELSELFQFSMIFKFSEIFQLSVGDSKV